MSQNTLFAECGTDTSTDCQTEYDNALVNGQLRYFYERCAKEGGSSPLRDECVLCCQSKLTLVKVTWISWF